MMSTKVALDVRAVPPTPAEDLEPSRMVFGRVFAPTWLSCEYSSGAWHQPRIDTIAPISLHPAAVGLHYAQAIFEGMKAYKCPDGSVNLFRPEENAKRFNRSAERMSMPALDEDLFVEGIRTLVDGQRDWVPKYPGSLYIRPAMVATEAYIGVRSASEFLFFVITLPSGAYFPQSNGASGAGAVRVLVASSVGRAARGGTGNVKASANYAVTLKVIEDAKKLGCPQVLFLDSCGKRRIEEMGGMNVFFVSRGRLITPRITDTILAGITRDSIIRLAPDLGIAVEEVEITLDELSDRVRQGTITEAFACGTAATIAGIDVFQLDTGGELVLNAGAPGPITARLHRELTAIQHGMRPDRYGWVTKA